MASVLRLLDDGADSSRGTPASPLTVCELPLREGPSGAERRFLPRLATSFVAHGRDDAPPMLGVDISFGGLMCIAEEPVWPGNTIDLDLELPEERSRIPIRGRVVELVSYRGKVAMRVRFEDVPPKDRKRIASWMARAYPKPAGKGAAKSR